MKNLAFAAMKHAGVTRDMLREMKTKQERLLLWMMVVATYEWR
jgi:hypothetical protein